MGLYRFKLGQKKLLSYYRLWGKMKKKMDVKTPLKFQDRK